MADMSLKKTAMPEQAPALRNKNFSEVSLGYTAEMAVSEAKRCLGCRHKPCVSGCPVNVRIPEFIQKIAEGAFEEAYALIASTNSLPAVCGRVCPQESQCEGKCVRGIKGEPVAVGRLERFAADFHRENAAAEEKPEKRGTNGRRVAVVGSGPAGLSCAGELARLGCALTVFEAFHEPGGVLVYGIPEFRLPKAIVRAEIAELEKMGVTIVTNAVVGRALSVDELFDEGFEAVFIGSGAGLPQFLGIPGENLLGVYSANEYLTRINLMKAYLPEYDTPLKRAKRVAVVGGGNVAMDAARCAKRMGAETVYIVYRRGMAELPARQEEVHHAEEEGIVFKLLNNPAAVLGDEDGAVRGLECRAMALGEPDESGRRRPVEIAGSSFVLDVDAVIIAIGTSPNPLLTSATKGLDTNRRGCIIADENGATSRAGVFAGGDAVTGAATVILAMGAGKTAAQSIDAYIGHKK
ncbi:MAG: NADPH-dependent glutamate synthase [Oscillospiraceae bacterium]|jgi:glutamate synthase (NADPH/NADH) small chain|nr:NADPH-dependent glutamate synthase [Oscillospiraceae bacterium]